MNEYKQSNIAEKTQRKLTYRDVNELNITARNLVIKYRSDSETDSAQDTKQIFNITRKWLKEGKDAFEKAYDIKEHTGKYLDSEFPHVGIQEKRGDIVTEFLKLESNVNQYNNISRNSPSRPHIQ